VNLIVNGNRVLHKIPREIKEMELLGIMEKIALYTFRNKETERITVTFNGKECTYWRIDFLQYL